MTLLSEIQHALYHSRHVVLVCLLSSFVFWLLVTIRWTSRIRSRYNDIPSLPRHPLWGNLVNCGERLHPKLNRHPDYGFEEIWNEMGQPSAYLVDLAPVDRGMLVLATPSIAEACMQPSTPYKYSTPKSDTYVHVRNLIGQESLITQEGETWRTLRKRFNPGFQPKYLYSLAPSVISKTRVFLDRLTAAAETGAPFELANYAKDLTTDIITQLTIERDLQAQHTREGRGEKSVFGILTASRRLSELVFRSGQGLNLFYYLDPVRPLKSWFYTQVYDRKLTTIVAEQLHSYTATEKSATTTKSIAQLAIAGLSPSPALIRNTVHQIKSFLFAGQDTTATLIQWLCFEMSKASHSPVHAAILEKLRAEHDAVFGADSPFSACDVLSAPDGAADQILASHLPYTTAFVKETLRLHPPAGTARLIPEADATHPAFEVDLDGTMTKIDGLRVYPCQHLIHRNPHIWGPNALDFQPERWLDEDYVAKLPLGAWRPFERGPRNCIGQELAMMEGKVVLACVARGFVFEKVGMSGRGEEKEVWSKHNVTSVPVDGMVMRVRRRDA